MDVEVSNSGNLRLSTTTQLFYATSAAPVRFCERFSDAGPGYDAVFDAIYLKLPAI